MSDEKFNMKLGQLGEAISLCAGKNLIEPTLMLLYSAIDICGWLANDDPNAGVRKCFVAWTDRYMEPEKHLDCTADDLYGARCGLVHMLSPDSDHNKKGKARLIAYAWGSGNAAKLNQVYQKAGKSKLIVAVHIHDLRKTWSEGVLKFTAELDKDPQWAKRVYQRAAQFFVDLEAGNDGKIKKQKDPNK
jgi:hypothetical protein